MKEIIATEEIYSPISNAKPIAIRYHYQDGTTAYAPPAPPKQKSRRTSIMDTVKAFKKKC